MQNLLDIKVLNTFLLSFEQSHDVFVYPIEGTDIIAVAILVPVHGPLS